MLKTLIFKRILFEKIVTIHENGEFQKGLYLMYPLNRLTYVILHQGKQILVDLLWQN